jgi:hypothetical protein
MEAAQTLNRHQFETMVHTSFSNTFEYDPFSNISTNIDLESWRTALTFTYGLSDTLDIRAELPVISTGGGFLDGMIQWYHNLFGLPNGGKDLVSDDSYEYQVLQNGVSLVKYPSTALGISDMHLRLKWMVSEPLNLPFKLSILPYIKIPTGQKAKGFSSGKVDLGLSFVLEKTWTKQLTTYSQIGAVYLTGQHRLSNFYKDYFISFGQSIEYQLWDHLSLITQLTGNTPLFTGVDTTDLSKAVLDLNIGFAGSYLLSHPVLDEFFYQWSFSEDVLAQGPSVDFSILFLMGVRY